MRVLGFIPRLLLIVGAGALLLTATVVGVAPRIWSTANAHEQLPVVLPEFESLAQRTYVYDANGQEIAFYELENSQPIAYEDIPQAVIDAFLVVEDKEFFTHDGINVRSLVRATLSNFASDSPQQGASTITMQVAKNDFLAGLERDGRYKLLQMHYARMLENQMSKQDIMARYLNTVFFGNNAYGIEAAAETYFGKKAADLTFIESAFLAGLVRSPSGFDPINEPERSRARWLQVLDRLVDDEQITEVEAERLAEEFVLPSRVKTLPDRSFARTYFSEALRDYLLNRSDVLGETYQQRYNQLFRGGLRIHTTLDANLQSLAEQARNELPETPEGVRCSRSCRSTRRPVPSGRWSGAEGSSRTNVRSTWRCHHVRPGRASSCSSWRPLSRQAHRPMTCSTGLIPARFEVPGQPPFRSTQSPTGSTRCSRTPRSRSTAPSFGCRRSSG